MPEDVGVGAEVFTGWGVVLLGAVTMGGRRMHCEAAFRVNCLSHSMHFLLVSLNLLQLVGKAWHLLLSG